MTRRSYLDENGRQCKRASVGLRALYLDSEIYGTLDTGIRTFTTWVAAPLCKLHAEVFEGTYVKRGKTVD